MVVEAQVTEAASVMAGVSGVNRGERDLCDNVVEGRWNDETRNQNDEGPDGVPRHSSFVILSSFWFLISSLGS
jgi:hypothetical protein